MSLSVMRSPRWQRRAAWAVGGLLMLWMLAWAAVPGLLKWQLEKTGSEKLGRQLKVGKVDFQPWSLELTLHDLSLAKAGASPAAAPGLPQGSPQLSIKRIYIDAELQSLLRLAPVLDSVQVEEPVLALTHLGEGRYDIDDIIERVKQALDKPDRRPLRFALYNLVLSGGRTDFNDLAVGTIHALRDLTLSVPFLSNLRSQRDVKTAPQLSFALNGSRFDTAAEGTPFAQTRKTDATFRLKALDLRPFLGYLPASLPLRLQGGVLDADIKIGFEQTPDTVVRISGTVTAHQVRLLGAAGAPATAPELLGFERLHVVMDDVRPLAKMIRLSSVVLTSPVLNITRDRSGRLNLLPASPPIATKNIAADARVAGAGGQIDASTQAASAPTPTPAPAVGSAARPVPARTPWKVQVTSLAVRGGLVNWLDQSLASPAQIRLNGLVLDASAISYPFSASAPLQFKGAIALDAAAVAAAAPPAAARRKAVQAGIAAPAPSATPALLSFGGSATDTAADVKATLAAWPLDMAAKYIGQFLLPALNGQLDAELGIQWQAATGDKAQVLNISAPQLAVRDILLAEGQTSLVSVKRVDVSDMAINVAGRSFKAASMRLTQPKAKVDRDANRRWMYQRWMAAGAGAAPPPGPASAPAWGVAIAEVSLDGGAMSFSDRSTARPVAFEVSGVKAQLQGLLLDERPAARAEAAKPMPFSASMQLATGRFEPGKLDFKGSLGLAPLQAEGQLALQRMPVQAFEPYFGQQLNIDLLRADASFGGRVAWRQTPAGPQAQLAGDGALEDFSSNTLTPSEGLLAWKALNLRGLKVALEPTKATRVDVRETVLSDFFARVIVTPEGRINLQDLLKPPQATATAIKSGAADARLAGAGGQNDAKNGNAAASGKSAPAPIINVGPLTLINGRVLFSDRFVRPNYTANLSELGGKLSAFSSAPTAGAPAMANLELRGRAESTASLEITGKLNPLAKPLALDIQGKVRDLELPPLSPYAVKYSGYGISRGKLSVDVSYLVQPDGQLSARNKVVLNQLSFSDKVEGSTASLPVKLAAALLADRNGVIDLDLPISGSLSDPQFSLGPVIVKVILNVIVKAITAPFSLLAGAFGGGGEELASVGFAPGSARLAPEATASLDRVAKALTDRPTLQLTVVGTASLDAEREAYRREGLDQLLSAEKRRSLVAQGGAVSATLTVSPAESPALLKEVYKRADITKPRNVIGLARELPPAEMEKLLLADIAVTEDAMRELALRRAVVVKDYLASRDLAPARLLVGAAKTLQPDAKWTPRAELNLVMP
ncbi:MAG: DUF748 domain-containing protein [Polaromonas sp.]|nr:DUF748 domain-containing protein [Polaromonas sp.]